MLLLMIVLLLAGCKKDHPCSGIDMTQNSREVFVGKWRWYKTTVREWFDVGPDVFHDYTPVSEGFEYCFILSETGEFVSYRNGIEEMDLILSEVLYEVVGENSSGLIARFDCSSGQLEFTKLTSNISNDSIKLEQFPLKFYNETEQRESIVNFFVRE